MWIYRAVCVVCVVVVSCYGCCVPEKGFFGPVRTLRTTVAPGMPDTGVVINYQAYDGRNKRVGIGYYDNNVYKRTILDYGKGIQLQVTGDYYNDDPKTTKCTKYPLKGSWGKGACVPENATRSEDFYMGHPPTDPYMRNLQAVAFTFKQGSLTAKVMVTQDTCNLVGEVVYDTGDLAGAKVINRLYVNQSMESNDDFFRINPNVTCVPSANPPSISQWDYMALFGWLLAIQE